MDEHAQALRDHQYLGDGVYASFDGYQVWLHVGAHTNPPVVAIEPDVMGKLFDYFAARVKLSDGDLAHLTDMVKP